MRYPHSVNGRFYGNWHYLPSGKALYLAHRRPSEVFHRRTAWCIDVRTLEEAKTRGISYVGVVTRNGKKRNFWITLVEDFFTDPHSFSHFGDTRQRGLPLSRFRVNPSATASAIASAMSLR